MSFEELLQKYNRLKRAIDDCKRLSRHGSGHSAEEAGLELFEAERDYYRSMATASLELKTQVEEHIKMLPTAAA